VPLKESCVVFIIQKHNIVVFSFDALFGLMIRPFCITILYHNLVLFIDIFHIERWYLCCFLCFTMFDDYWRACCRSQDSAGKRTIKTPYFWRSAILGKYLEIHISSEDGSSQKERARWATRGPHHQVARASPRPRHLVVWLPWPTSASTPSHISSPRKT
jgi:hypothetical protein